MGRAAAVFDLDRTLLVGASGPVFGEKLREAGVLPAKPIPGEGIAYRIYDLLGETRPSMMLTRQAARAAAGWSRSAVRAAGESAAGVLAARVPPFALQALERHRREGLSLVMATTTPEDLVEPLAAALGFDALLATRYRAVDGVYAGEIEGELVWGKGKLAAVRSWAEEAGVDLEASFAYSDSYYDLPLLSAVGNPVAVNPDPRLHIMALARRWPVLHFDVPPGVPKLAGVEPQRLLLPFVRPELIPFARFDVAGVEHLPQQGPAILVANHRSYFDPVAIAVAVSRRGRPVRFLGKKEIFDAPVLGQLVRALGAIRVERGSGSDEPLEAASAALRAGELVAVLPQGTIPRGRAFFDPVLRGRWGAARLAALSGAPVVPLGLWGTEEVWPRSARLPNLLALGSPPAVRVRLGPPVALGLEDPQADTAAMMSAIVALLPPEARVERVPTAEELARTFPPGQSGDPDGDSDRRPGEG